MPFLLALLGPLLGKVVDTVGSKLGVDMNSDEMKSKTLEINLELEKLVAQSDLKQLEINLAEASHPARKWPTWRESLGYVCVAAVAYHFVLQQFLAFLLTSAGVDVQLPYIEMTGIMTILSAMLGVHFVDSRYNSQPGVMPVPGTATLASKARSGKLVNDPESGGLVWKED